MMKGSPRHTPRTFSAPAIRCRQLLRLICLVVACGCPSQASPARAAMTAPGARTDSSACAVLKPEAFRAGLGDDADWVLNNAPLLECPNGDVQQIYYFRWHVYHEHLKQTPAGWVVTEFLPDVPWAGKYNTISCAAGHH